MWSPVLLSNLLLPQLEGRYIWFNVVPMLTLNV